ncbi:MAG TPA: hypothetical protein PLL76_20925 [Thermoanaerobaculia bacterium]|nr:hypothetical protein [Thermoanaerobaculia bacterium]HQP88724.1 hypothetical protein [Thermoanaerobaculia bacterium]
MPDISTILSLLESSRREDQTTGTERLRAYAKEYARNIRPLYHVIPWSDRIVSEEDFRKVYTRTVELTDGLHKPSAETLSEALRRYPRSLMVFRLISGYQWEELSDIVGLIRGVKIGKEVLHRVETGEQELGEREREAVAGTLFDLIAGRAMPLPDFLDPAAYRTRNAKIDTKRGWTSVAKAVEDSLDLGHLLYERYTGRPFAYVRDALSEAKGDILESAVEKLLRDHKIPFERIEDNRLAGYEQAPDFVLPSRKHPSVFIEAKLSEDGGTSRDKAGRIERLFHGIGSKPIALVAVIDGKGFRRINDVLAPILKHTRGRTFFLSNLSELVELPEVARLKER